MVKRFCDKCGHVTERDYFHCELYLDSKWSTRGSDKTDHSFELCNSCTEGIAKSILETGAAVPVTILRAGEESK